MSQQALENLNDQKKIENFEETINNVISFDIVDDAREIFLLLKNIFSSNPEFKQAKPELFKVFQNFLTAVKFVIIFDLPEKDIIELVQNNFSFVFDHPGYDIERKLRYKISDLETLEKRDNFKNAIRQALLNNKLLLTKNKITVSGGEEDPSIANWLRDYLVKLGIEPIDSLKFSEYIIRDQNTKNLSETERGKLKILLNLFEKLKVSSVDVPIFEENFVAVLPNQEIAVVSGGRPEKISKETINLARNLSKIEGVEINKNSKASESSITTSKNLSSSDEIPEVVELEKTMLNYPESSFEYKAIQQEIKRLKTAASNRANVKK